MNYNRAVMKQEVRQAMRQTRPHPMLVTLLYLVAAGIGASAISWLMTTLFSGKGTSLQSLLIGIMMNGGDLEDIFYYYPPQVFLQMLILSMTVSLLVSILTTAWNGLMSVGYSGYCLDMVRGMAPPLERIFGGFSRAGSVIPAYILVAVFTGLWSMLFAVIYAVIAAILSVIVVSAPSMSALSALLMVAATIGYVIGIIWVVLRYAMVPYAIIDSQTSMSAMDAIRTSKTIMKGRKGSFVVLRLSFIGWYLLEYLVIVAGVIIAIVATAGTIAMYADRIEDMFYYGSSDMGLFLVQLFAPLLPIILVCGAVNFIINLWLTPYITGCDARFYLYAAGSAQPGPYQPNPYGGRPGPYGGPSGPYGGQSGPYGGQSGPYGGQSGPYGGQSGPYGGQSGPYNNDPYHYSPPSQSSFSGYTQAPPPPQYGSGTYSQWGAPQVPAAPAAPAAPTAPVIPAAPAAPEAPAEPADAPSYEEPYAEDPETPDDDTPRRPDGPNYPQ